MARKVRRSRALLDEVNAEALVVLLENRKALEIVKRFLRLNDIRFRFDFERNTGTGKWGVVLDKWGRGVKEEMWSVAGQGPSLLAALQNIESEMRRKNITF